MVMRSGTGTVVLLLSAVGIGCADYQQTHAATTSIWDVRATTHPDEVKNCRHITRVDSRDSQRGCGLTVQPTPEECLRYQVKYAGGDTLLVRGPMGDAYDCSGRSVAAPQPSPAPQPTATPPTTATPVPAPGVRVRIVESRELVRGCVYLDDMDLKTACPEEYGKTSTDCMTDWAIKAGGNTVLTEGGRTQVFSCKTAP
jgi:hypothetical protein